MDSCDKPDLAIVIPEGMPICSNPTFLIAGVVDAQFPVYPDVEPPPFCPCINDGDDIPTGSSSSAITDDTLSIGIQLVQLSDDCCEPEFEFQIDSKIPCLPLAINPSIGFSDDGTASVSVTRDTGEPGEEGKCEFDIDILIPPQAEMMVRVIHDGPGIVYTNDCVPPDTVQGIQITAGWTWDNFQAARMLTLTCYTDIPIPLIGKLAYADETNYQEVPLGPDSNAGKAVLGPPA